MRAGRCSSCRQPIAPLTAPGTRPMLFETLAVTGGTPNASRVGNVMSVPDPATVLMNPAAAPGERDRGDLPGRHVAAGSQAAGGAVGRRASGGVGATAPARSRPAARRSPRRSPPATATVPRTATRRWRPAPRADCARCRSRVLTAGGLLRDARDLAERGAEALEGPADLGRHDPHLVGVALGDLRQHLEVLVGQQRLVRLPVVDRLEDGLDGLPLTLRPQDPGLPVRLGREDQRLALALGVEDRGLLVALGGEDRRTAAAPRR